MQYHIQQTVKFLKTEGLMTNLKIILFFSSIAFSSIQWKNIFFHSVSFIATSLYSVSKTPKQNDKSYL